MAVHSRRDGGAVSPRWRCSRSVATERSFPGVACGVGRPSSLFRLLDTGSLRQETCLSNLRLSRPRLRRGRFRVLLVVVPTRRRPSSSSPPLVLVISGLRRRIPRHVRPRRPRLPTKTRNKHKHRKDRKKKKKKPITHKTEDNTQA